MPIIFHTCILLAGLLFMPFTTAKLAHAQQEPAATPQAQDTRSKVFNAESFELDNGMQVIVIPNERAPVVTHMVWYKVGAAHETAGLSGIAHFLEHLMFKGSKQINGQTLAPGEFSKTVRRLGGQDNAFTSQDYTAYYQSVPSSALETVMKMEAGRMRGMSLPAEELESERKVIIEERRQRTDNDPQAKFFEQLAARSYVNHPYATPIIGWMHEIETLPRNEIKAFYDRWYAPNNAILIVAGDVSPASVYAKAIDIYGRIPKQDLPDSTYPSAPPVLVETRIEMSDENVREPMLYKMYRAPSAVQSKKEALALDILSEIMGGGPSARLYQSLVTKQKIASNIGFSYSGERRSDSNISVYAVPVKGQSVEGLEAAVIKELENVATNGISEDELRDAKTSLQDSAVYARDSLSGPAMIIGRALASGLSLDDVEYWPNDIAAITREDVQNAAQYLSAARLPVTGILRPAQGEE